MGTEPNARPSKPDPLEAKSDAEAPQNGAPAASAASVVAPVLATGAPQPQAATLAGGDSIPGSVPAIEPAPASALQEPERADSQAAARVVDRAVPQQSGAPPEGIESDLTAEQIDSLGIGSVRVGTVPEDTPDPGHADALLGKRPVSEQAPRLDKGSVPPSATQAPPASKSADPGSAVQAASAGQAQELVTPEGRRWDRTPLNDPQPREPKVEPKPAIEVGKVSSGESGRGSDADAAGTFPGTSDEAAVLGRLGGVEPKPGEPIHGVAADPKETPGVKLDPRADRPLAIDRVSLVRQVADRIELLAASRPREGVTVHLDPVELGSITLVVKSHGSEIDARFLATHADVRGALEASRASLSQTLEARGLSLGTMSVGHHEASGGQTGHHPDASTPNRPGSQWGRGFDAAPTSDWRAAARSADGVDLWI